MMRSSGSQGNLTAYMNSIQRFGGLTFEREQELARAWQQKRDLKALHQLTEAHLRFVVKIARSYRGYGLALGDLIEEGNVGLLEAASRFEPERNLRFTTYAAYWIRAYILAYVLKHWSVVGIGTGPLQSKLFFRLSRQRARLQSALGDRFTSAEIDERLAAHFETSPERIRDMTSRLEVKENSLDRAAFREGETTVLETMPDERTPLADDILSSQERNELVRRTVDKLASGLSVRDRYILRHRFLAEDTETLAAIGRKLRLSRERVRQLETRLKQKLRRALADFQPSWSM